MGLILVSQPKQPSLADTSSNDRQLTTLSDSELPSASTYLPALASTLRQLMSTSSSPSGKAYYLSAAPQCPRPDASIPVPELLPFIDFFSVQFYNNPSCQLNAASDGFFTSLQNWSDDLIAGATTPASSRIKRAASTPFVNINNGISSPRLLIGTPAFSRAGSGYVDVATYQAILERVKSMNLPNLAGAMFWDGAYQEVSAEMVNGVNVTFAEAVRNVL